MYIETIELKDFRNYDYMRTDFDKRINLIYGDNAQGKTNILEAIYIASTTRSHRGARDEELIRMDDLDNCEITGCDRDAHIKVIIQKEFTSDRIDIHLKKNKTKGIAVNGVPIRKSADIFGILQVVFFYPEDLDIIRRGPNVRRQFMDMDLSRVDSIYLNNLISYNKVLDSRNRLLKDMSFKKRPGDEETLDILDDQLLKYGVEIIKRRKDYIRDINIYTEANHRDISGGKENLRIVYQPSVGGEDFRETLLSSKDRDKKTGITCTGPHRDDFCFIVNEKDVKRFGSQGQKRTAALSLKLAQIDIIKNMTGEMPVLLLDDVLSELDTLRQDYLLKRIGDMQTLITCTGEDERIRSRLPVDKTFKVVKGEIKEE